MKNQEEFIKKILIISAIACLASIFWNFIVPLVVAAGLIGYPLRDSQLNNYIENGRAKAV